MMTRLTMKMMIRVFFQIFDGSTSFDVHRKRRLKVLDATVVEKGDTIPLLDAQLCKGRAAFFALRDVFLGRAFSAAVKLREYQRRVIPAAFSNIFCVIMSKVVHDKLVTFEKCLITTQVSDSTETY